MTVRRWTRVLAWAVAVTSLVLMVAGAFVFLADARQGSTVLEDVLDKRASVVSMCVGIAGLVVAVAALWVQLRSPAAQPSAVSSTGGVSTMELASPAVGTMSGGMVIGQATDSARVNGPGSAMAEGDRPIAIGGDNLSPLSTGDGAVTVTGQVGVLGSVYFLPRDQVASRPVRLAPRPPNLAGREETLASVYERLAASEVTPALVAVYGLGGVGKTSLALEYGHRYLHEYELVWQLPAEEAAVLSASFAELAALLGISQVLDSADPIARVHAALAAHPGRWLLIFDNAPHADVLRTFLPPTGNGHVIITSRSGYWPSSQSMELPVLKAAPAEAFLLARSGQCDGPAAAAVVAELGALPLALEQAGAYIADTGITLAEYLDLLHRQRIELLAHGRAFGYEERVASTWQLTFDQLAATDPEAAALLQLLSCYAPDMIPYRLLLDEFHMADHVGLEVLPYGHLNVNTAITALRRYSLIGRPSNGMVSIHRLVQAVTFDHMPAEQRDHWRELATLLLERTVPNAPEFSPAWPRFAQLLPHVRAVLPSDSPGLERTTRYLGEVGDYRTAVILLQEIIEQFTDSLKAELPSTLVAQHALARWTGKTGDAVSARDQLAALLPIQERVQGLEHPDTLATRLSLARWTGKTGDAISAREHFRDLLPIRQRVQGLEHPDTLATQYELARWTGEAGDAVSARDQLAVLLPIQERAQGLEHPKTLTTQRRLVYWTQRARRFLNWRR